MSKDLQARVDIPASVADVVALRTSERWVTLKADRLGDGSVLVSREERPDGGVDLAVSRELPDGVPGFLERFLPKDGRVVQHESWGPADGAGIVRGTWSVEIDGAPAKIGGTGSLEPAGTGSLQLVEGTVKVSIPLIGGKAESFLVDVVQKLLATEDALLAETLAG
ncbi:MAG: hypothetical protein JWN35_1362 [Frankiales bacterium]|nr:hypothetical protein [Frankiales bacterium]